MTIEVSKCCCCIELRTGCLIIGYLNLIANIAVILMSILGLVKTASLIAHYEYMDIHMQTYEIVIFAITVITLVLFILFLAFTIVLLVGLHQHKRGHVKAYLIYTLIFIVLYIISFFASFFVSYFNPRMFIRDLISIHLSSYFLLVIRSYYLKMNDPANKPAVYNTA